MFSSGIQARGQTKVRNSFVLGRRGKPYLMSGSCGQLVAADARAKKRGDQQPCCYSWKLRPFEEAYYNSISCYLTFLQKNHS